MADKYFTEHQKVGLVELAMAVEAMFASTSEISDRRLDHILVKKIAHGYFTRFTFSLSVYDDNGYYSGRACAECTWFFADKKSLGVYGRLPIELSPAIGTLSGIRVFDTEIPGDVDSEFWDADYLGNEAEALIADAISRLPVYFNSGVSSNENGTLETSPGSWRVGLTTWSVGDGTINWTTKR